MVAGSSSKGRVAVVGSGISGLAAAEKLMEAGYEVEIFEASDKRVGGKVESAQIGKNTVTAGAEFIDSNSEMVKLAAKHGIPLIPAKDQKAGRFLTPSGEKLSGAEFLTALRPVSAIMEE